MSDRHPLNDHWRKRREKMLPTVERLVADGWLNTAIARHLGVTHKVVRSCLRDLGIENPSANTIRGKKRRLIHPEVKARYERGQSVLGMSQELDVPRTTIGLCLEELGLPARSASEANLIRMAGLSHEQRKLLAKAANAKARGSGRSLESRRRAAKRREERGNGTHVGEFELEIREELVRRRIEIVPQWAFDTYNIDIFIPVRRVAVEVYVTSMRPAMTSHAARKTMKLLTAGVSVADIWIKRTHGERPTSAMYEQLVAFIDGARPLPTGLGEYRVIRGRGDTDPISQTYLDDLADVAVRYRALQPKGSDSD